MPELPEVEVSRRSLMPIVGRRVVAARVARSRMVRRQPNPRDFAPRLTGRSIRRLGRHGKFLKVGLSRDMTLVIHLGMSGRLQLCRTDDEAAPHTNVTIRLGGGVEVRLVDPRTFGFVAVLTPPELAESPLGSLGPDALDDLPDVRSFDRLLAGRRAPMKALLLDQRLIAGLGNIYADETLHRARISPHRPGGSLEKAELGAMRRAIRDTLQSGLRHGGTSLADLAYLLPDGRAGEYVARLQAYGREDEPCSRCGHPIRRDIVRARSTFWCPNCQR